MNEAQIVRLSRRNRNQNLNSNFNIRDKNDLSETTTTNQQQYHACSQVRGAGGTSYDQHTTTSNGHSVEQASQESRGANWRRDESCQRVPWMSSDRASTQKWSESCLRESSTQVRPIQSKGPRPSSSCELSRTSLLGRPLRVEMHNKDLRYRKKQNIIYNFLERPRGWRAALYHLVL